MKVLLQRVSKAQVKVDSRIVGKIGKGLLALVGFSQSDNNNQFDKLAQKLLNMRIFSDSQGKMNRSLLDIDGEILLVSQFTLYANTIKGNRPSFIQAAPGPRAENLYLDFGKHLEKHFGKNIEYGQFGADMKVELINDGPVTIMLEG